MTYSTGSNERNKWLRRAIGEVAALNEQITVQAIAAHLPPDFELETEEAEGMCADMGLLEAPPEPSIVERVADEIASGVRNPITGKSNFPPMITTNPDGHSLIPPEPLDNFDAPRASEIEPPVNPSAKATPRPKMTQQEASDAVLTAHNALQEARLEFRRKQEDTRLARAALATSISVWQTGAPPYTRENLVRDHIAASNAARAQRKEQGIPTQVKQVGKSVIDRNAAYSTDNSAEGFARNRNAAEGGVGGARRNAFPKSMKGQINFDPRRGPVPKLPSER